MSLFHKIDGIFSFTSKKLLKVIDWICLFVLIMTWVFFYVYIFKYDQIYYPNGIIIQLLFDLSFLGWFGLLCLYSKMKAIGRLSFFYYTIVFIVNAWHVFYPLNNRHYLVLLLGFVFAAFILSYLYLITKFFINLFK